MVIIFLQHITEMSTAAKHHHCLILQFSMCHVTDVVQTNKSSVWRRFVILNL